MANVLKRLIYLLIAGLVLVNCAGEDGDPGPAGEQGTAGEKGDKGDKGDTGSNGTNGLDAVVKIGTFEGTIKGTRRDGTAFDYPFTYEYTYANANSFRDYQGKTVISIDRLAISPWEDYAGFELEKKNGTLVPLNSTYSAQFDFHKEVNATTVFELEATASFEDFAGEFRPISTANNKRYMFSNNAKNSYSSEFNDVPVYQISGYNQGIFYSQATGLLVGIYDYTTDKSITSGPTFDLYNEIKFIYDSDLDDYRVVNKATGASLHEVIPAVPADKLTITNYSHNATTGILSFDFKLEISKYDVAERANSTEHDLVIEGKYNSGNKVYETTIGRTKN